MVMRLPLVGTLGGAGLILLCTPLAVAQQVGSIRGMIYDKDFEAPLPLAQITIVETGTRIQATEQGNYVIEELPPGTYTLIFVKDGYTRQVRTDVVVQAGQLTDVDIYLSGEFVEMEEFVVRDVQLGTGTEAGLLQLRMEAPALMDSISAELMSRAGAGDAAAALRLVAGATVQDGKYAIVRGLPDRYVNSQMNGVRLPTADPDKRAVELDQFPSAVIESIQVSKTFTPDQQGDASGGAVNIVLKGIPEGTVFQFGASTSFNTQSPGDGKFLTYQGGGVGMWGLDGGKRDIQNKFFEPNGGDGFYDGAVGVIGGDEPVDYKWNLTVGTKLELDEGIKVGGLVNFFYDRNSSFYDNGINDSYSVQRPNAPMAPPYIMTPRESQGNYNPNSPGDPFLTSLFDLTKASQEVKWGGLATIGLELGEDHKLKTQYLYTRSVEDTVTLAEDRRGKAYFFPGHDPYDSSSPGFIESSAAPYLRSETLNYTERSTQTIQFAVWHRFPFFDDQEDRRGIFKFLAPEVDWTVAESFATLDEPDKRLFGSTWVSEWNMDIPGIGPFVVRPASHSPYKPGNAFTLGNLQRTWKSVSETSGQYFVNLKLPFEQWSDSKGYFKFGVFDDRVKRLYNQDSFSNFSLPGIGYQGSSWQSQYNDLWSRYFPLQFNPVTPGDIDVDYQGQQNISAWYWMADVPLTDFFSVIGGYRYETTDLSIVVFPEKDVTWVPPGSTSAVTLNPGDADVSISQADALPSLGVTIRPLEGLVLRASYSETVARQTFKELTPIQQVEFLGGEVFIGNPYLKMSALKNYDLRADYTPAEGSFFSASYFYKDVRDPIEYVQRDVGFSYVFPINYPKGYLSGFELEARQKLGNWFEELEGLSLGANATLISSKVYLPPQEIASFGNLPNTNIVITSRDMTNAPAFLYNLYATYDIQDTGTQFALFYTVRGDTLVAGAGITSGGFIPDVYEAEYGTLNFSITQKLGEYLKLRFQAKNLTDPEIKKVYRSSYIDREVTRSSYTKGIDLSVGISAEFKF